MRSFLLLFELVLAADAGAVGVAASRAVTHCQMPLWGLTVSYRVVSAKLGGVLPEPTAWYRVSVDTGAKIPSKPGWETYACLGGDRSSVLLSIHGRPGFNRVQVWSL